MSASRQGELPSTAGLDLQLVRLCEIGIALTSERSLDRLLQMILAEARSFSRAEAGTLYIVEGDALSFSVVQNERLDLTTLPKVGGTIPIERTSIAGYVAATGETLNLADVSDISEDAPYRFNRDFDRHTGYHTHSMLVVPMRQKGGHINGVIQLINAVDEETNAYRAFDDELVMLSRFFSSQAGAALWNARLRNEIEQAYEEVVMRLARAAEFRDTDTANHIRRVAYYCRVLALHMGMSPDDARQLMLASPMHDVGKLGVPDHVLKKPGPLTGEERAVIEKHTLFGAEILAQSEVPLIQLSHEIAITHHERWDGHGYPNQLKGEEIPLSGRITAVADVFDALTTRRVYKAPMPVEEACAYLKEQAGAHFDPKVVQVFFENLDEILAIRDSLKD